MDKTTWGNACWGAFHCCAMYLPDDPRAVAGLLYHVRTVSASLPCPQCREHASYILSRQTRAIVTKADIVRALWVFHNIVNESLGKPSFPWHEYIALYGRSRLQPHMNRFREVMSKPIHGARDFANSWVRQRACTAFYAWTQANRNHLSLRKV